MSGVTLFHSHFFNGNLGEIIKNFVPIRNFVLRAWTPVRPYESMYVISMHSKLKRLLHLGAKTRVHMLILSKNFCSISQLYFNILKCLKCFFIALHRNALRSSGCFYKTFFLNFRFCLEVSFIRKP